MDLRDQRTITASGKGAPSDRRLRYLWFGLRWLVRLFLIFFIVFAISVWNDLLFNAEGYEQVIGSEPACAMSHAYCSWGNYVLAQMFPSLLGIAAIVALAWWRLPRRETILNILAILALTYLAWSVIQVQLEA